MATGFRDSREQPKSSQNESLTVERIHKIHAFYKGQYVPRRRPGSKASLTIRTPAAVFFFSPYFSVLVLCFCLCFLHSFCLALLLSRIALLWIHTPSHTQPPGKPGVQHSNTSTTAAQRSNLIGLPPSRNHTALSRTHPLTPYTACRPPREIPQIKPRPSSNAAHSSPNPHDARTTTTRVGLEHAPIKRPPSHTPPPPTKHYTEL